VRHATLLLTLALGASCGTEPSQPAPAPFVTKSVLAPALQNLEASLASGLASIGAKPEPGPDDQELGEGLIMFLQTAPPGMGDAAFEDAHAQGDVLVPVYARILGSDDFGAAEKAAAARLTAAIATPAAAELLINQLELNTMPSVRATCAWKLGDMGFDFVIPALIKRLKYEKDSSVTPWLGSSLAKLGNFSGVAYMITVAAWGGPGSQAAGELYRVVDAAGFEAAGALIEAWNTGDPQGLIPSQERSERYQLEVWQLVKDLTDFQLRGVDDSRFILSKLGKDAVPLLTEALFDENSYVRFHVAQALGRMGPRARNSGATLVLGLEDKLLAPYAAEALGSIDYPAAMKALLDATGSSHDPGLRLAAVRGLTSLADSAATPRLRELVLEEDFPELAQSAAEGLLFCGQGDVFATQVLAFAQAASETGLDADTSLNALAFWVRARAEAGETLAVQARDAYDALAPEPGVPPTFEEDRARRQARLDLFGAALPKLLSSDE
jgi:HEAT repeat protein